MISSLRFQALSGEPFLFFEKKPCETQHLLFWVFKEINGRISQD
jgi:hypothetical protein